jgi:hypothetical protein
MGRTEQVPEILTVILVGCQFHNVLYVGELFQSTRRLIAHTLLSVVSDFSTMHVRAQAQSKLLRRLFLPDRSNFHCRSKPYRKNQQKNRLIFFTGMFLAPSSTGLTVHS